MELIRALFQRNRAWYSIFNRHSVGWIWLIISNLPLALDDLLNLNINLFENSYSMIGYFVTLTLLAVLFSKTRLFPGIAVIVEEENSFLKIYSPEITVSLVVLLLPSQLLVGLVEPKRYWGHI